MAFLSRVGSVLRQSVSKQIGIGSQISASNPSIYQSLRCMSSSKVFIGGLPWAVDDSSLRETFSQYGDVIDAKVIIDREMNRSKGFGFVTFASTEEASSAIQAMDGQDFQGRIVKVNYATERSPRPFSGGYGGGDGYGGGGYGGQQNYGGGGGYGGQYGGQYGGGNSGGGQYGGGNSGGGQYGGGYASSGPSQGVADTGFGRSGFEGGSGDPFGSASTGPLGNVEPAGPQEGSFRDDDQDDFVKRA